MNDILIVDVDDTERMQRIALEKMARKFRTSSKVVLVNFGNENSHNALDKLAVVDIVSAHKEELDNMEKQNHRHDVFRAEIGKISADMIPWQKPKTNKTAFYEELFKRKKRRN